MLQKALLLAPLMMTVSIQCLLWWGYFSPISWLDRFAMIVVSAGGIAIAGIALFVYRLFYSNPWNPTFILATLLQFAGMVGSTWFFIQALAQI